MYPSIGDFSRPDSSGQASSSQNNGPYSPPGAARWPPPQLSNIGTQNGPPILHTATSLTQNYPLLRVQIADEYRTFPPVMINPGLEEIPRSTFTYDFSYERQLMAKLQSGSHCSNSAPPPGVDPSQAAVERFQQLGYTQEEVSFALLATGEGESVSDDKVVEACKAFKELRSMGFDAATVVGALTLHKLDLQAATDACLTAQS